MNKFQGGVLISCINLLSYSDVGEPAFVPGANVLIPGLQIFRGSK